LHHAHAREIRARESQRAASPQGRARCTHTRPEADVLELVERAWRAAADAIVGTIIVLVHVTLADRASRERRASRRVLPESTSISARGD
jgi:hypothetical protein